jgi:hypothetical protein
MIEYYDLIFSAYYVNLFKKCWKKPKKLCRKMLFNVLKKCCNSLKNVDKKC